MASFKQAVLAQVQQDPKLAKGKLGKGLAKIEGHDDGPLKRLAWRVMEHRVRRELGLTATEKVDWASASLDWKTILDFIIKILPLLLALFGV